MPVDAPISLLKGLSPWVPLALVLIPLLFQTPPKRLWAWLIDQPWGRWWKLPANVLIPIASFLTTKPPVIVEQQASWLAPIIWVLAVGVLIYGIDQSAREQARGQRDSLLAFSARTADLFRQEGDRILEERERRAEERERRALEAAIAAESEEIADLEK